MAVKKDNLPLNIAQENGTDSTITYANEVIAIIAGVAANEVEGIAGMCTSGGIADIIGKNRNITKGVKVEIGSEEASVDLYVIIEYGTPIQKAAQDAQETVRKAIETMTGLHVVRVDIHVQGVSFEKENMALESGMQKAIMDSKTDYITEMQPDDPHTEPLVMEEDASPALTEEESPVFISWEEESEVEEIDEDSMLELSGDESDGEDELQKEQEIEE